MEADAGLHLQLTTRGLTSGLQLAAAHREERAEAAEDTQVSIIAAIQRSDSLHKCLSINVKTYLL